MCATEWIKAILPFSDPNFLLGIKRGGNKFGFSGLVGVSGQSAFPIQILFLFFLSFNQSSAYLFESFTLFATFFADNTSTAISVKELVFIMPVQF